ncbi:MAG: hypothetical protein JXQ81_02275 [Desulfuromonadales bacterium]|nr:hypothetical protein [Desulfuromonadales bacterium]MBN2791312.1 hypothetical protein [Desulfuromonadales bacterium]
MIKHGIIHRLGRGKGFEPSEKGRLVYQAIKDDSVTDFENSAVWELKLQRIIMRDGMTLPLFVKDVKHGVRSLVDHIRGLPGDLVQLVDRIGPCPICDAQVINRPKSYSCEEYPECSFVLWKNRMSRFGKEEIARDEAQTLLKKQPVPFKMLKGKNGQTFSRTGYLSFSPEYGWGISFNADDVNTWPGKTKNRLKDKKLPPPPERVATENVPERKIVPEQTQPPTVLCCKKKGPELNNVPPRPSLLSSQSCILGSKIWQESAPQLDLVKAQEYLSAAMNPLAHISGQMKNDNLDPQQFPLPKGFRSHLDLLAAGQKKATEEWVRKNGIAPAFNVFQRINFKDEGGAQQGTIISILENYGTYQVSVASSEIESTEVPWEKSWCFKCHAPGAYLHNVRSV